MAKIVTEQFVITLSRLVKDDSDTPCVNDDQQQAILLSVPSILEEILTDPQIMVEVDHLQA